MTDRAKVEQLLRKVEEYQMDIQEIEMELEMGTDIRGISYDSISSGKTNAIHSAVENQAQHNEYLERKKKYLEIMIKRIMNPLNTLNERDRELMDLYYFQNMTLIDISFKLDKNDNYLSRRKANILDKLATFYKRHGLIN